MASTAEISRGREAGPAALFAYGERVLRRRKLAMPERAGVGATMSATFLGLLMMQGVGRAEEGMAGADAGGHGSAGGTATPFGEPVAGGMAGGFGPAVAYQSVTLGSMGTWNAGVDVSALTKLTGETAAAEAVTGGMTAAEVEAGAVAVSSPVGGADGTASIEMRTASAEPVEEMELPSDTTPDEDLGTVGENHTGGDGNDTIIGTEGDDNLAGGGGDDLIYGGNGNDHLAGNDGDDELHGDAGDDELDGGNGNDLVYGGTGNDLAYGGQGEDSVYGGADNDELYGGADNDLVDGGTGIDQMYGGTGGDRLVIDNVHDLALEDPFGSDGGGIDTLVVREGYGASLAQELPLLSPQGRATFVLDDASEAGLPSGAEGFAQQVHPFIENVSLMGSIDHDILGDGRDNRLIGNDGDNSIFGGAGADWLDGGEGDDWLQGGDGDDLMYGSGGDDMFVLGLHESGVDTIFDHSGVNTVSLRGASESRLQVSPDGDDLRIAYDGRDVAVIDQYVGHEANFAGLDLGQGTRAFPDLLAEFLPQRVGGSGADILGAANGGEWLVGKEGNDELIGSAADDRLEGGDGSDVMRGGAGDDIYLVRKGESGIDRIADAQGHNSVELTGHDGSAIGGFMLGNDLWVTADSQPVVIIEGHAAHPDSLDSIKVGTRLVDPNELAS